VRTRILILGSFVAVLLWAVRGPQASESGPAEGDEARFREAAQLRGQAQADM
jgi:hypothetical protein